VKFQPVTLLTEDRVLPFRFVHPRRKLKIRLFERLAECVLTSPTTAVFNGLPNATEKIQVKTPLFW